METSLFAFASDLADEGVDAVLSNAQDGAGVAGLTPAFSYHALRDVFPHNPVRKVRLGPNVIGGDCPQYLVAPDEWQAAAPLPGKRGFTLVSCVVAPAFEFSGFTLAPPNWQPGT